MEAQEIDSLFNDKISIVQYVEKDYGKNLSWQYWRRKFCKITCNSLIDAIIDCSKGLLIIQSYMKTTDNENPIADNQAVEIQNGTY